MSDIDNNRVYLGILQELSSLYQQKKFVLDKTGVQTIELVAHTYQFNPMQSLIDFKIGEQSIKTSSDYVKRELDWYLSEDLNIHPHMDGIKIWEQVADKDGFVCSNYGWMTFSTSNGSQYQYALETLQRDPTSRRAVMQYTRPEMVKDYNLNGRSDYCCTQGVTCLIRDNKLIYIVKMRSNDFIFGTKNDLAWACYVYDRLLKDLRTVYPDLEVGEIIWQADSLHIYQRHFSILEKLTLVEA